MSWSRFQSEGTGDDYDEVLERVLDNLGSVDECVDGREERGLGEGS